MTTKPNRKKVLQEDGTGQKYEVVNQMGYDKEIDIFDKNNEFSVYSLLPDNATFFKAKMEQVDPEHREMDHYDLRKIVKPSPTLNQLRINFWSEYDKCVGDKRVMRLNNIVAGVCSRSVFRSHCSDPLKMAWILTPLQAYQMGVQDIIETALYKMREGLEHLSPKSSKDLALAMRIYEAFDKRVHGEYTQKVEKKVEYSGATVLTKEELNSTFKDLGIDNNVIEVVEDKSEKKQDQDVSGKETV